MQECKRKCSNAGVLEHDNAGVHGEANDNSKEESPASAEEDDKNVGTEKGTDERHGPRQRKGMQPRKRPGHGEQMRVQTRKHLNREPTSADHTPGNKRMTTERCGTRRSPTMLSQKGSEGIWRKGRGSHCQQNETAQRHGCNGAKGNPSPHEGQEAQCLGMSDVPKEEEMWPHQGPRLCRRTETKSAQGQGRN